jgi:hypothetical protein
MSVLTEWVNDYANGDITLNELKKRLLAFPYTSVPVDNRPLTVRMLDKDPPGWTEGSFDEIRKANLQGILSRGDFHVLLQALNAKKNPS